MLKNLLKYLLPAVTALSISCSQKKPDFPEGFYITPDSTDVVREERGDLEVFYARDRLLVQARSGTEHSEVERIASELEGEVVGSIDALNWYELKVPDAQDVLKDVKKYDAIRNAELNYAGRTDGGRSNRYDIVEQSDFAEGFERIQVPEAYELLKERNISEEPIVAVLDSGFDLEHPELEQRYWRGVDFGDGDMNPTYTDLPDSDRRNNFEPPGHGTAVAGIIAAENNGQDLNGVAYNAKILPVKLISSNADVKRDTQRNPNRYFAFKLAAGIAYAAQQGAGTINMSIGWYSDEPNEIVQDAVDYATEQGSQLIASAGNDNRDAAQHFPSSLEGVLSVGAVTMDDRRADFSNYSLDDSREVLAVSAPGHRIAVVEAGEHGELALRDDSGTSYSAPFVSGLDALLASVDSSLSARERRRIILDSAERIAVEYPEDDAPPAVGSREWRRVNAYRAVGRVVGDSLDDMVGREGEGESEMESKLEHDSWAATSTEGAPEARREHTAVWTGSEMIVWGGRDPWLRDGLLHDYNSGSIYNPVKDTWEPISTINAPAGGYGYTVVWTGSEMIVWGGRGGCYNPLTNNWRSISTIDAPDERSLHTAVWTSSEMIIWGGMRGGPLDNGGRYDPRTDSWMLVSTVNAPDERSKHTATWTGSEMIIFGGDSSSGWSSLNTGGKYEPDTDFWTPTSLTNVPERRYDHTASWTGSRMIVWGGYNDCCDYLDDGALYDPIVDRWSAISAEDVPIGRRSHTETWTGSEMIVWGGAARGLDNNILNSGGRYDQLTNSWTPTSLDNAPVERVLHTVVWTGSEMIVWGGNHHNANDDTISTNTGGRYRP